MLISIITPSYNQGEYIEECILSVMNQGFKNFEHIIVDGESTDNTLSILKKYPHLKSMIITVMVYLDSWQMAACLWQIITT